MTREPGSSRPPRQSELPGSTGSAGVGEGVVVVDARGLLCPAPVIALARAARQLPEGARIRVLATDPAAAVDVPAWARMRGHTVAENKNDGELLKLTVVLGPQKVS